jgi:hypothetical protein
MSSLQIAIAVTPLIVYLTYWAAVRFWGRTKVISGLADSFLLGLGLAGFFLVGPLNLFLPEAAASRFGGFVWLLLLTLYFLVLSLLVLLDRPRIIVYNASADQVRTLLSQISEEVDKETRWAGETCAMPQIQMQFHVAQSRWTRTVQLVAVGWRQNFAAWRSMEERLRYELAPVARRSLRFSGLALLAAALALTLIATYGIVRDYQQMAQALNDFLRL